MWKFVFILLVAAGVLREITAAGECNGNNEIHDPCPDCSPQTCASKGKIYNCPMIPANKTGPNCKPACRCEQGYLRNNCNQCIPENECGGCGGDENAQSGCGTNCGKKCSDVGKSGPFACPEICYLNGCDCKDGFYLDSHTNKCVAADQCSGCGGDENAQSGCGTNCGKKCSDIGKSGTFACPAICYLNGCDCKDGFYLDSNTNKCVPADQCSK